MGPKPKRMREKVEGGCWVLVAIGDGLSKAMRWRGAYGDKREMAAHRSPRERNGGRRGFHAKV